MLVQLLRNRKVRLGSTKSWKRNSKMRWLKLTKSKGYCIRTVATIIICSLDIANPSKSW